MQNIYKPSLVTQMTGVVGGSVCLGLMAFGFLHGGKEPPAATILLSAVFAAVGVLLLRNGTEKIVLSDEAIEAHNLFRTRRLQRGDIAGWEVCVAGGRGRSISYSLRLLPQNKEQDKPVRVSENTRIDAAFKAWLLTLPNLTTNRLEEKIKALKAEGNLGDPKAGETLSALEKLSQLPNLRFVTSSEEMTKLYFAQWGL